MKILTFIVLVVFLYSLTPIFMLRLLDTQVSIKYEVFEPTESEYYTTLKTKEEKEGYVNNVEKHNANLYRKAIIYKTLITVTFLSATVVILFRKRIIKN